MPRYNKLEIRVTAKTTYNESQHPMLEQILYPVGYSGDITERVRHIVISGYHNQPEIAVHDGLQSEVLLLIHERGAVLPFFENEAELLEDVWEAKGWSHINMQTVEYHKSQSYEFLIEMETEEPVEMTDPNIPPEILHGYHTLAQHNQVDIQQSDREWLDRQTAVFVIHRSIWEKDAFESESCMLFGRQIHRKPNTSLDDNYAMLHTYLYRAKTHVGETFYYLLLPNFQSPIGLGDSLPIQLAHPMDRAAHHLYHKAEKLREWVASAGWTLDNTTFDETVNYENYTIKTTIYFYTK